MAILEENTQVYVHTQSNDSVCMISIKFPGGDFWGTIQCSSYTSLNEQTEALQEKETVGPNIRNAGECQVLGYEVYQGEG